MFKQAIKFTHYLQEKNGAMKMQINLKHSINTVLKINE